MTKTSAGILLYKKKDSDIEFFLVHPGGPFWSRKDLKSWSIPKGEFSPDEDPLVAARREFKEETGNVITGNFIRLTPIRQKGGKLVHCYACEGEIDPGSIRSNTFEIEWPPASGRKQSFPEVDKGAWFDKETALEKINESQAAFIEELLLKLPS